LLNLKPTTVLEIPVRLFTEYGISSQFLQDKLYEYTIQTVGKDYLEKKFNITNPTVYYASATMHYSWPKGCGECHYLILKFFLEAVLAHYTW
jgi:hypothetical protein